MNTISRFQTEYRMHRISFTNVLSKLNPHSVPHPASFQEIDTSSTHPNNVIFEGDGWLFSKYQSTSYTSLMYIGSRTKYQTIYEQHKISGGEVSTRYQSWSVRWHYGCWHWPSLILWQISGLPNWRTQRYFWTDWQLVSMAWRLILTPFWSMAKNINSLFVD